MFRLKIRHCSVPQCSDLKCGITLSPPAFKLKIRYCSVSQFLDLKSGIALYFSAFRIKIRHRSVFQCSDLKPDITLSLMFRLKMRHCSVSPPAFKLKIRYCSLFRCSRRNIRYYFAFRKISEALCPPNPSELDIAYSISARLPSFGTISKSHSGSGTR